MDGLQEEAGSFEGGRPTLAGTPFEGLRRYRTFGPEGPMYQVMEVRGDRVLIWCSNSDEEAEISLASALADPLAE